MINAQVVAHSKTNFDNDELISLLVTFPRIILAEVNTHRMLSKNTSSSRAIPFNKMLEAVKSNPFVPIAWQRGHSGMQGTEYLTAPIDIAFAHDMWLEARDAAIKSAKNLNKKVSDNKEFVTKQLCNRLLEPYMWTTMLITGGKEGWENFFNLRCPQYSLQSPHGEHLFRSKEDAIAYFKGTDYNEEIEKSNELEWLKINKGQAEIHIMDLAEKIYDAIEESTPKLLNPGEWHIPFEDNIPFVGNLTESIDVNNTFWPDYNIQNKVKISTAMGARTSYTIVGEEKEMDYNHMIGLHDRLIGQNPPHSSPMEHCARAMTSAEYNSFVKGKLDMYLTTGMDEPIHTVGNTSKGWCRNFRGFIPYRHLIESK